MRIERAIHVLADGTALAVGAVCLAAATAAQGGRFNTRLDLLTHFAPFWALGCCLAAGYGLAFASPAWRPVLIGVGAAGVLAAAALMVPEMTRSIRPAVPANAPRQIKLIQFNAWDHNADVEASADWIAAEAPDLVLMQEVERPIREAMIRRGFHYLRGMARTAIFSRAAPTWAPVQVPPHDWPVLPSFSRATFISVGGDFSVVAVHLDRPTDATQKSQMAALLDLLSRYPTDRLIVAGDFNLTPWSFTLRRLDDRMRMERLDRAIFSWPARLFPGGRSRSAVPFLPIDHVYAGSAWRVVKIERGARLGSDHYPLIATLALED